MNATRLPPGAGLRQPQDTGSAIGQVFVLDRVRIEVALEARSRYKYVNPQLVREGAGWTVRSPNCSRNVDKQGGVIDIAWLVPEWPAGAPATPAMPAPHASSPSAPPVAQAAQAAQASPAAPALPTPSAWLLHAKDHRAGRWVLKLRAATLDEAITRLVKDEHREFWL